MFKTATKRMRMIADDLAEDGNYTRAASVYAVTAERDALWLLKDQIRIIAECEDKPATAIATILERIKEHDRADHD